MSSTGRGFYAEDLAYVHHAGFSGFSRAAAPTILHHLHAAGIRRGHIVELGCGSGVLARALTSTGYTVHGIDVSASMVRIARRIAPSAHFEPFSIARFAVPACDAVLSVGEAIGYLPAGAAGPKSLRPLFARVARALNAGGLFIFDLLMREDRARAGYKTWHAGDDWAVLVEVQEHSAIVTRRITTFRAINGTYRRSAERHLVGAFRRAAVVQWLRAEGFSVQTRRRYGPAAPLLPGRLAFIATRR